MLKNIVENQRTFVLLWEQNYEDVWKYAISPGDIRNPIISLNKVHRVVFRTGSQVNRA